jgi:ABC-type lipoprotein release transport system permease subunit
LNVSINGLQKLPPGSRDLITKYHQGEEPSDKARQKELARSLAIPVNALRIRAHRIGLALTLAAVGLYGVLSYPVAQRTREIWLRMALGAERRDVVQMVVEQGRMPALLGVTIGLLASLGLTQLMQALLFGVSPADPQTLCSSALLLIFVALLACFVPPRRAEKLDPMAPLRCD